MHLAVASFIVLLLVPFNFSDRNFGADAQSYFSHATTLLFNSDLSYENDLRVRPKHPYGASLWIATIALPFALIDSVQEHPIIEDRSTMVGSWTFFGMLLASPLAFVAGFLLLYGALRELRVARSREFLWLLLVGAGVGGFWAHFNFLHAHAVEFLSVAAITNLAARVHSEDFGRAQRSAILLPFALAYGLAVRPSNVGLLLLPFAIIVLGEALGRAPGQALRHRGTSVSLLASSLVAGGLLVAGNVLFYGQLYPTVTTTYGRDLFRAAPSPISDVIGESATGSLSTPIALVDRGLGVGLWYVERIAEVPSFLLTLATTAEFGLLWWTPVLVIGPLSAVVILLGRGPAVRLVWRRRVLGLIAVGTVYAIPLAVVFRWQSYGSGWGYRYLLPTLPLSIVLVFALLKRLSSRKRAALRTLLIATALFSILSQVFFYTTAEFRPEPGVINTFGRAGNNSLPRLGWDVLGASVDPRAWAAAFAGRATGFLGLQLIGEDRAVGLLQLTGLSESFRYSVDEALALIEVLPDGVRWAYNVTLLAFPLLHFWLMRPPRLPDNVQQRFRSRWTLPIQSLNGKTSEAQP